jgi:hypothetical protein
VVGLALVLLSPVALASEAICDNPDQVTLYTGQPHWVLVKQTSVIIDKTKKVRIRQFRSREVTGCTGAGGDLHSLKVLIDQGGRLLYQRESGATTGDFWLERPFSLRDTMGGGTPQVVFDSGESGASDWFAHEHIVPLTGPQQFTDVAEPDFVASWRYTIGWFRSGTGPVVVTAVPTVGDAESDPDGFCHGCPHPYRYRMYQWHESSAAWKVVKEIDGSRKFDGSVDSLVKDRGYIRDRLP